VWGNTWGNNSQGSFMPDTQVFKVLLIFEEDGVMGDCPAYEYEGAIWLVPNWIPFPNEGYTKPERMIRLDQFRFQKHDPPVGGTGPFAGADYSINDPLPKMLLTGELTPQLKSRYVVLDKPDAKFRVGGTRH
jgi:hypothetical protein